MVLDIVMPNAHRISNSSTERPMLMDGTHHQVIRIPVKVNGDLAALRWTFGKPTLSQVLLPPIHVPMMDSGDARMKVTVETPIDTVEFVIKMVVILTHIEPV